MINRVTAGFVCGALASLLCACDAPERGGTRTVEYFRAHAEERKATLNTCAADPGTLAGTPNCINARIAQQQEAPAFDELPPMGLMSGESR